MLRLNNKLIRINGGLARYIEPPPPPIPDYLYFSFKMREGKDIYFDPIGGVFKYWDNSYSTDLTTGSTFQTNGGSGDWPNFYASQDHVYQFVWDESDLARTFESGSLYGNNSKWDSEFMGCISEIYSLDFWHSNNWNDNQAFSNCTVIPQSSSLIFRGESLTSCSYMFAYAPITNSIEAFILAMQTACPNLSNTSSCFVGCTTAPDYNYCLTTYPNWF